MKNLFFFLCCFIVIQAHAQLQRNYNLYSVDNGLAQNSVTAIFQDHRGYLWFGTADGMNRFDGYKMNYYKNNSKDSNSLSGIKGYGFYEDSQKRLWVSHHKGVSIYNRIKDNFINLDLKAYNRQTMILREDKHNRVWLISGVTDLIAINTITLKLEKRITLADKVMTSMLPYYASSIRSFIVLGDVVIGYLNDNNVWFTFDLNTLKYKLIRGPKEFLGMFYAINDSTLCSFTRDYRYLYHVRSDHFTKQPYHGIKFTEYRIAGNTMAMWNGLLYIANTTGLYIYDAATNTMTEHIQSFTKYEKKGFFYVQNLWVDRSNNLWISTNGDGVKCLSPYANKFKHYASNEAKNRLVKAICTDKKGTIYTGLWGQDLLWYTSDGNLVQHHFKKDNVEISSVLGLTPFDESHVMLVNGKTLKIINPETRKVVFEKELNARKDIRGVGFPHFARLNNNKWLLSADRYIYEIDKNYNIEPVFELNNRDTTITVAEMNPADNSLWIGTNRGLFKYHPASRKRTGLPVDEFIKSICVTSNGRVYIGAEQGLFELDSKGKLLNTYSVGNKLVNDFIYGILEDRKGNIWFSHNKGLSCMNPATKQIENYTAKDGIQSNEFNTGAYYKDEKGLLYFGGVNGVNVIDPDRITKNSHVPQVAINEIMLGDVPYRSDTSYNEITQLCFDHTQNTLSFDFSALEFSQPEFNTYRYQLSGYDTKWIESGTKHFARYANLPPGKYVLKIKAANSDGVWNEDPRELPITILPPYWQTGWFYALVAFAGTALLSTIVYVVINRQKIKIKRELEVQQKLEQERLRISRDLHDNVGAQLSYLITNVEWMLENPNQLDETEEKYRLQALTETGRNAILTLRQTIWAISHTSLSVEDFADRFKQFALKMLEFNKSIHVTFSERIETGNTLSPAVALNLFRICQEAFNNCLKHAACTEIHIGFESSTMITFEFIIADNGVGFDWDEAQRKGHYGLQNMQARARETGAGLQVESAPGKGTRLVLSLK